MVLLGWGAIQISIERKGRKKKAHNARIPPLKASRLPAFRKTKGRCRCMCILLAVHVPREGGESSSMRFHRDDVCSLIVMGKSVSRLPQLHCTLFSRTRQCSRSHKKGHVDLSGLRCFTSASRSRAQAQCCPRSARDKAPTEMSKMIAITM